MPMTAAPITTNIVMGCRTVRIVARVPADGVEHDLVPMAELARTEERTSDPTKASGAAEAESAGSGRTLEPSMSRRWR